MFIFTYQPADQSSKETLYGCYAMGGNPYIRFPYSLPSNLTTLQSHETWMFCNNIK